MVRWKMGEKKRQMELSQLGDIPDVLSDLILCYSGICVDCVYAGIPCDNEECSGIVCPKCVHSCQDCQKRGVETFMCERCWSQNKRRCEKCQSAISRRERDTILRRMREERAAYRRGRAVRIHSPAAVAYATKVLACAMIFQLLVTSFIVVVMSIAQTQTVELHYSWPTCWYCYFEAEANYPQFYEWGVCTDQYFELCVCVSGEPVLPAFGVPHPPRNLSYDNPVSDGYFAGSYVSNYILYAGCSLAFSIVFSSCGVLGWLSSKKEGFVVDENEGKMVRRVVLIVTTVGFIVNAFPTIRMFSLYIIPGSYPPGCYVQMFSSSAVRAYVAFFVSFIVEAVTFPIAYQSRTISEDVLMCVYGVLLTVTWLGALSLYFIMFGMIAYNAGCYQPIAIFSCWFIIPVVTILLKCWEKDPPNDNCNDSREVDQIEHHRMKTPEYWQQKK